jgi:WD40 repeat protein
LKDSHVTLTACGLAYYGRAINVHKDHVSAVLTLDYSPTGREIVTGSYDKSVRIFGFDQGHSREVYHTKRMQVRTRDWLWIVTIG